MVPSALTARKASTSLGSSTRALAAPCENVSVGTPVNAKATVSAPPLSTARRDKRDNLRGAFMSASLSRCRHYRTQDPRMRSATAKISVERGADLRFRRLRLFGQKRDRAHDHAAR